MTVQEALDLADGMKPNMLPRPVKIKFLNELEGKIHEEVLMKHEHTAEEEERPDYENDTNGGTVLLVPAPYDMVYPYYIMSCIDHVNQEMDKYNNDRAMFENRYAEMCDWWNRTRMPVTMNREIRI